MAYSVPVTGCPACGKSHMYSIVQEYTAIRNSPFKTAGSWLSRWGPQTHQPGGERLPWVRVSARCPETGSLFGVNFMRNELASRGLDPARISLALAAPESS